MRSWQGTWHNQYGSEIQLEVDEGGRVHGLMTVGGPGGRGELQSFPLVGFARGDLIAFTVDFGRHGSLTSWVGHLVVEPGEAPRIESMWHMGVLVPHPERNEERWKSTWTGADEFRHGPRPPGPRADGSRRAPPQPLWLM